MAEDLGTFLDNINRRLQSEFEEDFIAVQPGLTKKMGNALSTF